MSDNKYNPTVSSKSTSDQKIRDLNFANAAKAQLKQKYAPEELDAVARLLKKAEDLTSKVRSAVKPVVEAGGWKDKSALRHFILTLYLEAFDTRLLFTREDLVQICALLHTDIMMETVESDPTLSGKPDLLSGK